MKKLVECGKQQRCKCTPQVFGHCSINKHIYIVAKSWRETSSTIIQNCFGKGGFKHHSVDPQPPPQESPVVPAPDV